MKKSRFFSVLMLLLISTSIYIFYSCDPEPEPDPTPNNPINSSPTPTPDPTPDPAPDPTPDSTPEEVNHKVTGVGQYSWDLNSSGNITSYIDYRDVYTVTNNGKTFTLDESDDDETVKTTYVWTLNSKGLASKLEVTHTESWTGYKWDIKETHTFTYNNDNQLISMTSTYSDIENDEGDRTKISGKSNATFKYSSGKLTEYTENWSETEDGDTQSGTLSVIFTYGNTSNPFKQYTPNVVRAISWIGYDWTYDAIIPYIYTGRLGEASSFLPTSISGRKTLSCTYSFDKFNRVSKADNESYTYQSGQSQSKLYLKAAGEGKTTKPHIRGKRQRIEALQHTLSN